MRHLIFFAAICLVVWLGTASPIDPKRWLINRPSKETVFGERTTRARRSAQEQYFIKGRVPLTKTKTSVAPELNLRKGEYICGNKVCKLRPGQIPPGCNELCQYPI